MRFLKNFGALITKKKNLFYFENYGKLLNREIRGFHLFEKKAMSSNFKFIY